MNDIKEKFIKVLEIMNDNKAFVSFCMTFLFGLFCFLSAYMKSIYYNIPMYYFYTIFNVKLPLIFIPFILIIIGIIFIIWPSFKEKFLKEDVSSIERVVSIFANFIFIVLIYSVSSEHSYTSDLLILCIVPLIIILVYNLCLYRLIRKKTKDLKTNNLKHDIEIFKEKVLEYGLIPIIIKGIWKKIKEFFAFLLITSVVIIPLLFLFNFNKVSEDIFQITKKSYELLVKSQDDTTGKVIITIYGDQYVVMDFNIEDNKLHIKSETCNLYHKESKQINDSLIKIGSNYDAVIIDK